jgi:hypothetical protein
MLGLGLGVANLTIAGKAGNAPLRGELVNNGNFDSADLSSFTVFNGATHAIVSNALESTNAAATSGGLSISTAGWISGATYRITFDVTTISGIGQADLYTNNALDTPAVQDAGTVVSDTIWSGVHNPLIRYAGGGQLVTDKFSLDNVSIRRIL